MCCDLNLTFKVDLDIISDLDLTHSMVLKEAKREILRDMHVKELIQSNHSER